MKTSPGNIARHTVRFFLLLLVAAVMPRIAAGQDGGQESDVIPLISMKEVPLWDAVRNLARQAKINYILDPRLPAYSIRQPTITARLTNLTAVDALNRVLSIHNLTMVSNPVTSIARISPSGRPAKPVSADRMNGHTNAIIPLIVMDTVPLPDAIRNLAKEMRLAVSFDRNLRVPSSTPDGCAISECKISVRWTDVTARQALMALLDDYDLVMVEDPGGSSASITALGRTGVPPGQDSKDGR
jgi:hypothetical protein